MNSHVILYYYLMCKYMRARGRGFSYTFWRQWHEDEINYAKRYDKDGKYRGND